MRRLAHILLAGAVAIGGIAPAFADPPHRQYRDRDYRHEYRGDHRNYSQRDYRDGYRDGRRQDNWRDHRQERRAYNEGWREGQRWDDRYDRRYSNASRYWRSGDYIPRGTRYVVVHDYGRYHLPPPRRGHYYADYGDGDILLVAAATGLVVWALSQNRY